MDNNINHNITNDRLPDNMEGKEIFKPRFIPYFLGISSKYSLTPNESLLYGFIVFYLLLSKTKDQERLFYFSTTQLSDILNCSKDSIKDSLRTLHRKQLIFRHTTFTQESKVKKRSITLNMPIIQRELYPENNKNIEGGRGKNTPQGRGKNYPNNYNTNNNNINKEILSESDLFNLLDGKSEDNLPPLPF